MKILTVIFVSVLVVITAVSIKAKNANQTKIQRKFPDFGFMVPVDQVTNANEVFKLSQDYPKNLPNSALPKFYKIDYKTNWREYLLSVRDYCFEGNTNVDFRVENNKARNWYHMPFQHYSANGREGFHGLTKEAPVKPHQLAISQDYATSGAWAVGFFNDVAGYTIGRVWADHDNPNPALMKGGFKHGAVLFKLLFTSIPKDVAEATVPFFRNGIWWDAYATYNFNSSDRSKIQVVLTQMDIMVRDDNAPNGWVFGNFQYNGAVNDPIKWRNLIPVGLMWGQDPTNNVDFSNPYPTNTIINTALKETIINPDAKELPPTHLGWNGRLNGPLDNSMSSCYSCHSTAEYPQGSPISPLFDPVLSKKYPPGSDGWMLWFRNLKCAESFDKSTPAQPHYSTDFCLQMSEALENFVNWKGAQGGLYYNDYVKSSNIFLELRNGEISIREGKVYPVDRRNK